MLERTSPAGLLVGGAVLALSIPPVRRALRSAAVSITAGMLTLTERVQNMMATGREELEDLVVEAKMSQITKDTDDYPAMDDDRPFRPESGSDQS
jgi:phosphopantothenate synthetase